MFDIAADEKVYAQCAEDPSARGCECYGDADVEAANRNADSSCFRDCFETTELRVRRHVMCGQDCAMLLQDATLGGTGAVLLQNACFGDRTRPRFRHFDSSFDRPVACVGGVLLVLLGVLGMLHSVKKAWDR